MGENVLELKEGLIKDSSKNGKIDGEATSRTNTELGEVTSNKGTNDLKVKQDSNSVHLSIPEDGFCQTSLLGHPNVGGALISFKDVSYQVKVRTRINGGCCKKKNTQHYIVKNASGIFGHGVNAILGPTGSGKTSLLDILAGRKDHQGLSGEIMVNGAKQPSNFKCMIGYVIQDDVVMGMLTVRENIEFSAALRLPRGTSTEKRKERVEEIISELGLSKCANTKIGTEFQRGVSGGERKRTNIAIELITSPSVLFLDEPTTGLDAFTAHSVLFLLKRLSHRGMTIIMSIHQPRYSIFKLFDTMMLMSGGECVFHGPALDALEHFRSGNYICEDHNNPPDFFLDILSGCIPPTIPLKEPTELVQKQEGNTNHKANGHSVLNEKSSAVNVSAKELEASQDNVYEIQRSLVNLYLSSKWYQKLQSDLSLIHMGKSEDVPTSVSSSVAYPTSFPKQLAVVSKRTWHNMIRNRHALLTQMFSALILGLIVGSIYFQVDDTCSSGIENRVGAFFFIVMNYIFGNMSAVDIFIKERAIFIHESLSGFYRVSAYFFSKLFCDITPQRVFPIVLFATITYFMIGFQMVLHKFFFYLLNIFLTSISGAAVALFFSASTRQHSIGTVLSALVWVSMMVFSGRMVKIETIPHWLQWLKWLSIFRYSLNGLMTNELKGFDCTSPGNATFYTCTNGDECLTKYGVPHETIWDLWSNEVALILLSFAFLLLTYIQLRRITLLK